MPSVNATYSDNSQLGQPPSLRKFSMQALIAGVVTTVAAASVIGVATFLWVYISRSRNRSREDTLNELSRTFGVDVPNIRQMEVVGKQRRKNANRIPELVDVQVPSRCLVGTHLTLQDITPLSGCTVQTRELEPPHSTPNGNMKEIEKTLRSSTSSSSEHHWSRRLGQPSLHVVSKSKSEVSTKNIQLSLLVVMPVPLEPPSLEKGTRNGPPDVALGTTQLSLGSTFISKRERRIARWMNEYSNLP
ncbi:hypothetical protein ABKN59_007974 [Abortiporus biennis]